MNPSVIKQEGFLLIDRVIEIVSTENCLLANSRLIDRMLLPGSTPSSTCTPHQEVKTSTGMRE
jgi:hypothetical protein